MPERLVVATKSAPVVPFFGVTLNVVSGVCSWKLHPAPAHSVTVSATMNWLESGVLDAAGLLARSLYAPAVSTDKLEKVATPATAAVAPPPDSAPPLGLKLSASDTFASESTTWFVAGS